MLRVLAVIMAAEDTTLPSWLQYGILGLLIVVILVPGPTRLLVPSYVADDAKQLNRELEGKLEEAQNDNKDLVALLIKNQTDSNVALTKSSEALAEATLELRALRRDRAGG